MTPMRYVAIVLCMVVLTASAYAAVSSGSTNPIVSNMTADSSGGVSSAKTTAADSGSLTWEQEQAMKDTWYSSSKEEQAEIMKDEESTADFLKMFNQDKASSGESLECNPACKSNGESPLGKEYAKLLDAAGKRLLENKPPASAAEAGGDDASRFSGIISDDAVDALNMDFSLDF